MSEVGAAGMGLWLSGGDQEDQKPESWCPGWGPGHWEEQSRITELSGGGFLLSPMFRVSLLAEQRSARSVRVEKANDCTNVVINNLRKDTGPEFSIQVMGKMTSCTS